MSPPPPRRLYFSPFKLRIINFTFNCPHHWANYVSTWPAHCCVTGWLFVCQMEAEIRLNERIRHIGACDLALSPQESPARFLLCERGLCLRWHEGRRSRLDISQARLSKQVDRACNPVWRLCY